MELSVVLCTYNGSLYIGELLESIVNQTLSPNEIVVCGAGALGRESNRPRGAADFRYGYGASA